MRERGPTAQKAYKNLAFLNSPDARVIRMLSEFLEPQRRLRRAGIRDTIVFFGSARICPRAESARKLKKVRAAFTPRKRPTLQMLRDLRTAELQHELSRYYDETVELAAMITRWSKTLKNPNRFVVCSGGGPGIMEAANRGAKKANGTSIGLNISLPFEQSANPYVTPGLDFEFHYFFMRKFWFVYPAKALVVFPGGFGTMDELMELLTLLQTDKIKKRIAVIIYGKEYWTKIIDFDALVRYGMISREDLKLFTFVDSPREAFEYLKKFLMRHYPTTKGA